MKEISGVMALRKADILRMRGRGSGDYDYQVNVNYGCFDWEVVCTASGGYTQDFDSSEYDYDWLSNGEFGDGYGDADADGGFSINQSEYVKSGMEVVEGFENGDNHVFVSDSLKEALNLGSTCVTGHSFALSAIEEAAKGAPELATLGKFARGIGGAGAAIGVILSVDDLRDGHITPQDIGMAIGAGLGAAAAIIGVFCTAPVLLTAGAVAGGLSVCVTFFSYCLSDEEDKQSQTGY